MTVIAWPAKPGAYKYIVISWNTDTYVLFGDATETHYGIALAHALARPNICDQPDIGSFLSDLQQTNQYVKGGGYAEIHDHTCHFHGSSKQYGAVHKGTLLAILIDGNIEQNLNQLFID
jgi:hypothetical protein